MWVRAFPKTEASFATHQIVNPIWLYAHSTLTLYPSPINLMGEGPGEREKSFSVIARRLLLAAKNAAIAMTNCLSSRGGCSSDEAISH